MSVQQPGELDRQLMKWAGDYAEQSDGRLALLDYDPNSYPGQEGHAVAGSPGAAAMIDSVATAAQPLYPELKNQLNINDKELDYIGELTKGGNNVAIVTNHGDLIDIAVTHAAVYSLLRRKDYKPKTGLIMSKMVSYLAYRLGDESDPAPCAEILKLLEDHVFLSYPRTESTAKRGISSLLPDEIKRHNRAVRKDVSKFLGEGSVLLAVAPSGTTDKKNPNDTNETLMSTAGTATTEMLSAERTYIAPIAVSFTTGKLVMKLCDIPRLCDSENAVTTAMESIASVLTENTGNKTTYLNP